MEMIEKLAREFVECMYDDGAFGEYDSPAIAADHQWQNYTFAADRILRTLREPTDKMHNAARDWSHKKYGKAIGKDASEGCWRSMIDAALATKDDDLPLAAGSAT